MKIVECDNFGREWDNEYFVGPLPRLDQDQAQAICDIITSSLSAHSDRWYKVVGDDYKLRKMEV